MRSNMILVLEVGREFFIMARAQLSCSLLDMPWSTRNLLCLSFTARYSLYPKTVNPSLSRKRRSVFQVWLHEFRPQFVTFVAQVEFVFHKQFFARFAVVA